MFLQFGSVTRLTGLDISLLGAQPTALKHWTTRLATANRARSSIPLTEPWRAAGVFDLVKSSPRLVWSPSTVWLLFVILCAI